MRKILMFAACLAGCAEGTALCTPMIEVGPVAVDERSAVGVSPSEVVAGAQQSVSGTLRFYRDDAPRVPADLHLQFAQVGDAVEYDTPPGETYNLCGAFGPHLAVTGVLQVDVVPSEGAAPFGWVDPFARVLAYGPGDNLAVEASQNIELPTWLDDIAVAEGFTDVYTATSTLTPLPEDTAHFWAVLMSGFGVDLYADGDGLALFWFDADPDSAQVD